MLNLIKRYMPPVKSYRVDLSSHNSPMHGNNDWKHQ
jgi:hypothetical protein